MKKRVNLIVGLIFNLVIFAAVAFTFANVFLQFIPGAEETQLGLRTFLFFTNDSNILLGLACLVLAIFEIVALAKKKALAKGAVVAKFAAAVMTTITLLVTAGYLVPVEHIGLNALFGLPYYVFAHLALPVLGLISIMFFDIEGKLSLGHVFVPFIPLVAYAVPVILLVIFGKVEAPYSFLKVTENAWYVSVIAVSAAILGTSLLGLLILFVRKGMYKALNKNEAVASEAKEEEPVVEEKQEQAEEPVAEEVPAPATEVAPAQEEPVAEEKEEAEPEPEPVQEEQKEENEKEKKEEAVTEEKPVVSKPAQKKQATKKAPAAKKEPAKKLVAKKEDKGSSFNGGARVYHVSKHASGKWQIKLATSEKAIKLFSTQAEAIDYAKDLVKSQGGSLRIHSKAGKIRKE